MKKDNLFSKKGVLLKKVFLWVVILVSVAAFDIFTGKWIKELEPLEPEAVSTVEVRPVGLSDWEMLQMAIVKTESDFRPEVKGKSGTGLFQATAIYIAEVNRLLGEDRYELQDALDPVKSKEMFDIIQGTYNPNNLVSKAIELHNPDGGETYKNKVMQNLNFIRRYESVREIIRQSQ